MFNEYMVGMQGDNVVIVRLGISLPRRNALEIAAWIAAMAEEKENEFNDIRKEIEGS